MPRSRLSFKKNTLTFEAVNVESRHGEDFIKAGHVKVSLDVADLLKTKIKPVPAPASEFGVEIWEVGNRKIQVIKEVRTLTGWGLVPAKSFVEQNKRILRASDMEGLQSKSGPYTNLEVVERALDTLEAAGASGSLVDGDVADPTKGTVLELLQDMLAEALNTQVSQESAE